MNSNHDVVEVLKALDRVKSLVPKDWEYLSQDEDVLFQVMEMEYNQKPLSEHLGIDKALFPPPENLEDDEIKAIVDKILETWAVYNYLADLPKGLPIRIAYTALLSVWDETVMSCPIGHVYFDFYEMELDKYVSPSKDIEHDF